MAEDAKKPKLLAVIGPTASGKSSLAVALAKRFGGEVISADSRQFYIGNEIGADTVKGDWQEIGGERVLVSDGVPHHLVSFREIDRPVDLAEFKAMALAEAEGIVKRGRLPILCGGTGLYVQAVADGYLMPDVPADPNFRESLAGRGTPGLFGELLVKDPDYAARIAPNNRRYIVRALEVIAATGRPFSSVRSKGEPPFVSLKIGLSRPREELYVRIDRRVDELMAAGLLEETRQLSEKYDRNLPAMSGLGHRQMGMHLRGEVDLPEAIRLIKRDTRHYARRQMIWWRRDPSVVWVSGESEAIRETGRFLSE